MANMSWRTVVTKTQDKLKMRDNQMVIISENEEKCFPVEQIGKLLIASNIGSISFPLLVKLASQNTKVIFCDGKMNPVCEVNAYFSNYETAGRLMDQAVWTKRKKSAIWRQLVKMKISRQMDLLKVLKLDIPEQMVDYLNQVEVDDVTNREAMASKIYFNVLFGKEFRRFDSDNINAALNYGYTILCSAFNRAITMMGYSTALGIHHCNRQNNYNFSCDLMEPFRPFVDNIVYRYQNCELDWTYRQKLIGLLRNECIYKGKKTELETAIQVFVKDVAKGMSMSRYHVEEIQFA